MKMQSTWQRDFLTLLFIFSELWIHKELDVFLLTHFSAIGTLIYGKTGLLLLPVTSPVGLGIAIVIHALHSCGMELPISNVLLPSLPISFTCTAAPCFAAFFSVHNLREKKKECLGSAVPEEPYGGTLPWGTVRPLHVLEAVATLCLLFQYSLFFWASLPFTQRFTDVAEWVCA